MTAMVHQCKMEVYVALSSLLPLFRFLQDAVEGGMMWPHRHSTRQASSCTATGLPIE